MIRLVSHMGTRSSYRGQSALVTGTLQSLFPSLPLSRRHDWYQTESQVIVTIMAKNVPRDGVRASFTEREVRARTQVAAAVSVPSHGSCGAAMASLSGVSSGGPIRWG